MSNSPIVSALPCPLQIAEDIDELKAEGRTDEEIELLVESGRVAEVNWKVSHSLSMH